MEGRHSILIAHGHAPTRIGVRQALRESPFEIVAEAECADRAVELCLAQHPELSLLDLELPGGGLWAAHEISTRTPDSAVIMLSACASDGSLLGALRAGAIGYLMMDLDPARLPNALQSVLEGEAVVPRRLVISLIEAVRAQGRRSVTENGRGARLTRREWEVFELMNEGLTTVQAAEQLFVSPVTVRRHLSNLVKKLEVSDREAALQLLGRQA
jgi:DNA-binding NarL/FixJ family response regulator